MMSTVTSNYMDVMIVDGEICFFDAETGEQIERGSKLDNGAIRMVDPVAYTEQLHRGKVKDWSRSETWMKWVGTTPNEILQFKSEEGGDNLAELLGQYLFTAPLPTVEEYAEIMQILEDENE